MDKVKKSEEKIYRVLEVMVESLGNCHLREPAELSTVGIAVVILTVKVAVLPSRTTIEDVTATAVGFTAKTQNSD